MTAQVTVRVPATSANLGPGFDCLGLALDLWNEAEFSLRGDGLSIDIEGEGADRLPTGRTSMIANAFYHFLQTHHLPEPHGIKIVCRNAIPTGSGLGSSASAVLLGLLAANALHGSRAGNAEILAMAAQIEGHADNIAAALQGSLAMAIQDEQGWLVRRIDLPPTPVLCIVPELYLPTQAARRLLPLKVKHTDAVFNLGHALFLVEALRSGDIALLARAMQDRLHQSYRLERIPGGADALAAARRAGAAAALSGAGPSLIAFCPGDPASVERAMCAAFRAAGVNARSYSLFVSPHGAQVSLPG